MGSLKFWKEYDDFQTSPPSVVKELLVLAVIEDPVKVNLSKSIPTAIQLVCSEISKIPSLSSSKSNTFETPSPSESVHPFTAAFVAYL